MLSTYGEIVQAEWARSAVVRAELALYAFVVMPNHVHGIVVMRSEANKEGGVGAHGRAPLPQSFLHRAPRSLGSYVAGFKATATTQINQLRGTPGAAVWQRNYYEHIIRTDEDLSRIREYVISNPLNWDEDPENPARVANIRQVSVSGRSSS